MVSFLYLNTYSPLCNNTQITVVQQHSEEINFECISCNTQGDVA